MSQNGPENTVTVYYFDIPTIMCSSCTADIRAQVLRIAGVSDVQASEYTKTAAVTVSNPSSITANQIIAHIQQNTKKQHTARLTLQEVQNAPSSSLCHIL